MLLIPVRFGSVDADLDYQRGRMRNQDRCHHTSICIELAYLPSSLSGRRLSVDVPIDLASVAECPLALSMAD